MCSEITAQICAKAAEGRGRMASKLIGPLGRLFFPLSFFSVVPGAGGSVASGSSLNNGEQVSSQASPLDGIESEIAAKKYDKARGMLDVYISAHPKDARA